MAAKLSAVNGAVLQWARERSGLSLKDAGEYMNKEPQIIHAWEQEEDAPTYCQLEKIAYDLYKRPLAIFFFPAPPEEMDPKPEFRLFPQSDLEILDKDTLYAVRKMQARQISLKELTSNQNPANLLITDLLNMGPRTDLEFICARVREILGITIQDQINWTSTDEALKQWRRAVEGSGVFVFKRSFKEKGINGFCLTDKSFPIICINNSTAKSRQIFTLFHELGHLFNASNGFTKDDQSYMSRLSRGHQEVEVLCNRFAAELLVPTDAFMEYQSLYCGDDESLKELASIFSVSREVVLRRFLDEDLISADFYQKKRAEWNAQYLKQKKLNKSSGNYYRTQFAYLGESFIRLCFKSYYQGKYSREDLSQHLGVKAKQLSHFESMLLGA